MKNDKAVGPRSKLPFEGARRKVPKSTKTRSTRSKTKESNRYDSPFNPKNVTKNPDGSTTVRVPPKNFDFNGEGLKKAALAKLRQKRS